MGRKKKASSTGLPANLYPSETNGIIYYIFRHPVTHKRKSFGSDRGKAVRLADKVNAKLLEQGITEREAYVPKNKQLKTICRDFLKWKLPQLKKGGSQTNQKNHVKTIIDQFGTRNIESLKTGDIYKWLDQKPDHSYIKLRTILNEVFTWAISTGRMYGRNPVDDLLKKKEPKRERRRLTKEQYRQIYEKASPQLRLTMSIMLFTGLRPDDCVKLLKSAVVDNVLHVKTEKTGVIIEYTLTPKAYELIVSASRQTGIPSPYLVHYMPRRVASRENWPKWRKHRTQCNVELVSREFTAIRDELGIDGTYPIKKRPSLYECRSAAGRWLEAAGIDKAKIKALYGHIDGNTTEKYLDDEQATKRFYMQCVDVDLTG